LTRIDRWCRIHYMKLREYREDIGWTQDDVAKAVGITLSHVSLLENGKKNASLRLAKKIVAWSNGAVAYDDLLVPDEE